MKLTNYSVEGKLTEPCELVVEILKHNDLTDFLKTLEFESKQEVVDAIFYISNVVRNDKFVSNKEGGLLIPSTRALYKQFENAANKIGVLSKYAEVVATELYNSYFLQRIVESKVLSLSNYDDFEGLTKNEVFVSVVEDIKILYGFSDMDIKKLQWFVSQCRDVNFDRSRTKVLYFHSKQKGTGKTTVAQCIISALNCEKDLSNVTKYSSDLNNEMQMNGKFTIPLAVSSVAVLMDEAFYKDMGKTYNRFKQMITSSGGWGEVKFGSKFYFNANYNYIITSNESLSSFIKDWDDRRYLNVEFTKVQINKRLDKQEIFNLWNLFVLSCPSDVNWEDWTQDLYTQTDVKGEYTQITDEIKVEFLSESFRFHLETETHQLTLGKFQRYIYNRTGLQNTPCNNKFVKQAVYDLFGESTYWNKPALVRIVDRAIEQHYDKDNREATTTIILPEITLNQNEFFPY